LSSFCPTGREYAPRPENRAHYDRLYEQFLRAFQANFPIFEALNPVIRTATPMKEHADA
jgi:hypothetical protein